MVRVKEVKFANYIEILLFICLYEEILLLLYQQTRGNMKYTELHRKFVKAGWQFHHAAGSHYFYEKDGKLSMPIPFHGSKEIGAGLANKLLKEYGQK